MESAHARKVAEGSGGHAWKCKRKHSRKKEQGRMFWVEEQEEEEGLS